ncbi:MAG TPA: hypothetical protein VH333_00455 [Pseudonocardiaceae bacterium]|jgi:hypothetical protein|nr:hypothetical protein [Pseudonocardiaceae bacterium]
MSAAISENTISLMSEFGVDLNDLNSTDLLAELVIDAFDQWSIPPTGMMAPTAGCGRDLDLPALAGH